MDQDVSKIGDAVTVRMRPSIICSLIILLGGCTASRPVTLQAPMGSVPASTTALARELEEYVNGMGRFGLSATVLVGKGDSILMTGVEGWANRERGIRNHRNTIFQIGSMSKQFTASAILKLEMQGRLHVTDSLRRFFPDVPPDKANITLHQLLTHTSGITTSGSGRACITKDTALRAIFDTPLYFAPGTRYRYSNAGYSLLAMVVEAVAAEPFESFMHRELWDPIGMRHTGFGSDSTLWSDTLVARGYNITVPYQPYTPACAWNVKGAGVMMSTVDDLFAWSRALDHGTVLTPAEVKKLFTPNVATGEGTMYGYGWVVARRRTGVSVVQHRGDLLPDGFNSGIFRFPEDSVTVVLLSNVTVDMWGGQSYPLGRGVEAILFGGPYGRPPAVLPHAPGLTGTLSSYVGTYRGSGDVRFDVGLSRDGLTIGAEGQTAIDALVNPRSRWDTTRAAQFNRMAQAAVEGAIQGDTAYLRARLGAAADPAAVVRSWTSNVGGRKGATSIRVLGSVPIDPGGPTSYVRVTFPRDTIVVRLWWDEDGRYVTMHDGVHTPALTTLLPTGESSFLGYDMFNERPVRIRFERGADGRMTVGVETPVGRLSAVRPVL